MKAFLISLRNHKDKTSGICHHLAEHTKVPVYQICALVGKVLAEHWPLYSGDLEYPIPHSTLPPNTAFTGTRWRSNNYWDRRTTYGKNRYSALECLIEHSNELEEYLLLHKLWVDLRALKESPPLPDSDDGICIIIDGDYAYPENWVSDKVNNILSRHWPLHSGNEVFPIPCPNYPDDADAAYIHSEGHWDASTEYGRNRFSALDCLIKQLTEQLT